MTTGTAETIREQLGNSLAMIGAKNLVKGQNDDGNDWFSFRIGKNVKRVNYMKITLNEKDLYDIEYGSIRGINYNIKSEDNDIYADGLKSSIEKNTGLCTSL